MQADFGIELASDDETLDFPWADPEGRFSYLDLKRHPELLTQLPEVQHFPELKDFLAAMNSSHGVFESAKCDAWASTEMNIEDEVFDATWKFGSYVDVLLSEPKDRFSFEVHESLAGRATALLKRVPEIPASAEFLLRRCYFADETQGGGPRAGFYITSYVFGYGADERQARMQWAVGLKLLKNALLQAAGETHR
jgi:hypothetical protein